LDWRRRCTPGEWTTWRLSERRATAPAPLVAPSVPVKPSQIAVSFVLVVGATLFARTLVNLEREPLGFDQDNVLLVPINPWLAGYTPITVGALYRRLYDQVSALPGVEAVIGSGIAVVVGQSVASQLFGIVAHDPPSFAIASAILAFVALLASLVPALRALRIHPSVALRAE
jgi:hypothetical protein